MAAKKITPEQVDKILDQLEKEQSLKSTKGLTKQQISIIDICAIVKKVIPVLKFVRPLLFWKPRWQKVIDHVITSASSVCSLVDS